MINSTSTDYIMHKKIFLEMKPWINEIKLIIAPGFKSPLGDLGVRFLHTEIFTPKIPKIVGLCGVANF